jgi:GWxTD domain-containing protein
VFPLLGLVAFLAGCAASGPPPPTIDFTGVVPEPEAYDDAEISHLQYILDEDQQKSFLALPTADRPDFLRVIWAATDPTPTTAINERKIEHYRKLAVVRSQFARKGDPPWDKRGELLLRYGAPDQRRRISGDVVPGLGLVPPKEIWIYQWLGQAYELEDPRFQSEFVDAQSVRRTSRSDVVREVEGQRDQTDDSSPTRSVAGGADIAALGADADTGPAFGTGRMNVKDAEAQVAQDRLQSLYQRGQEGLKERPRAYRHDPGGEKLEFAYSIHSFSDYGSGKTRVEVSTGVRASDLGFMPVEDRYAAVLGTEAVIKTVDYREAGRAAQRTRDWRARVDDLEGRLVLDQITVTVEPGEYRLALSVQDSLSHRVGVHQAEFTALAFPPGELALSDIQFALDVKSPEPDAPFVKGAYQVVPYPLSTFVRDQRVFVYFEAYGLTQSPSGDALYTVGFRIQPHRQATRSWFGSSKGQVIPGVATAYDGVSASANVQEYFSLDPSTFEEDSYDVQITVTDRISDRKVTRSATFSVQP